MPGSRAYTLIELRVSRKLTIYGPPIVGCSPHPRSARNRPEPRRVFTLQKPMLMLKSGPLVATMSRQDRADRSSHRRPFLFPLPVEARQISARRRLDVGKNKARVLQVLEHVLANVTGEEILVRPLGHEPSVSVSRVPWIAGAKTSR
jgi:hypothetical protein